MGSQLSDPTDKVCILPYLFGVAPDWSMYAGVHCFVAV